MGGIVIMITLIIGAILLYNSNKELLPLSVIIIGFGIVGFVDDFKKLILKDTEGLKQVGTAIIIPFLKIEVILPALIYIPFAIFVMLARNKCD